MEEDEVRNSPAIKGGELAGVEGDKRQGMGGVEGAAAQLASKKQRVQNKRVRGSCT